MKRTRQTAQPQGDLPCEFLLAPGPDNAVELPDMDIDLSELLEAMGDLLMMLIEFVCSL